jgi:hemerythrin
MIEQNIINYDYKDTQYGINAILLNDKYIDNNKLSNLIEFPLFYMLYNQSKYFNNNTIKKPIILYSSYLQILLQMNYFYVGHYGIVSIEELEKYLTKKDSQNLYNMKLFFAQGEFKNLEQTVDLILIPKNKYKQIHNQSYIQKISNNNYQIKYKDSISNINLTKNNFPTSKYIQQINTQQINTNDYFSIIHIGEGDGWNKDYPSMGSIVNFNSKLYIIDTPPNIDKILVSLNISINDIEGIIHTHIHDDHFIGFFSLLNTHKKLKYIASPLIRENLLRKLASIHNRDILSLFFDVIDLDLDKWNNIDGMEIKPFLSAHPVDTTCLFIRAKDTDTQEYKTYAHLADIAGFDFLDNIKEKKDIDNDFINKIKDYYKTQVNVKKIDVGGGIIHGNYEDFLDDKSTKIRFSHLSDYKTIDKKYHKNIANMGEIDTLIETKQNNKDLHYKSQIKKIFDFCSDSQIDNILNTKHTFNPNTVIYDVGDNIKNIYLILSGEVKYINKQKENTLINNSHIGKYEYIQNTKCVYQYISNNYVSVVSIPKDIFQIKYKNISIQKYDSFLYKHFIYKQYINDEVSLSISTSIQEITLDKDVIVNNDFFNQYCYILKEGSIEIKTMDITLDTINKGDFFDCPSLLHENSLYLNIIVKKDSTLLAIDKNELKIYPFYNTHIVNKFINYHEQISQYITDKELFININELPIKRTKNNFKYLYLIHILNMISFIVKNNNNEYEYEKIIKFYMEKISFYFVNNTSFTIDKNIFKETKNIVTTLETLKKLLLV